MTNLHMLFYIGDTMGFGGLRDNGSGGVGGSWCTAGYNVMLKWIW